MFLSSWVYGGFPGA